MPASIGVDFDNTIVCYDTLFFNVALEMGLIPEAIEKSKNAVRNHILAFLSNDEWTVLQSEVYGTRLPDAEPYAGVQEFLYGCRRLSIPVSVISHKSRFPALGKRNDLHRAALTWLEGKGFLAGNGFQLSAENVHFTETRVKKIEVIERIGCEYFIDDLPEVFADESFPPNVKRILFDPNDAHVGWAGGMRIRSWKEIQQRLFKQRGA
jgi:hypothetical protein